MMYSTKFCLGLVLCVVTVSAIPSYPYPAAIPETGRGDTDIISGYGYRLVPTNEYAIAEYQNTNLDIWDYIPSPATAIKVIVYKTWAVTKWVVEKAGFVVIGAILLLGVCGLSPYCSISFDNYPIIQHGYRSILDSNALSQVEDFVYTAIDKFQSLQQAVTN